MNPLLALAIFISLLGCLAVLAAVIAWVPYPRVLQVLLIILGSWPLVQAGQHGYGLWRLMTYGHGGGPEALFGMFLLWIIPRLLVAASVCFLLAAFLLPLRNWLRDRLLPELRPYNIADD